MPKKKVLKKIASENKSEKIILVRYGEIFLKSDPVRRRYTKRLQENIKHSFKTNNIKKFETQRKRGRIFITVPKSKMKKSTDVLANTFGIVSFSVCDRIDSSEIKNIQTFAKKNYKDWIPRGKTFGVRGKRSGTQKEKYTSQQLAKRVGDVINRKVNLSKPDVEVFVEVRGDSTYFYTEVLRGLGGMPVGTAGRIVCLLSGGIDSPVAAWMMMKRGCIVDFVHLHPFKDNKQAKKSKIKDIVEILGKHLYKPRVYFVPIAPFDLLVDVDPRYNLIIFRRYMMRLAEKIAEQNDAKGIVTGDSLAQVASQTLENLRTVETSVQLPIFRPLIGFDKQEIVEMAEKINTYKLSIKPYRDCCSIVAKKPATKSKVEDVEEMEKNIDMDQLIKMSIDMMEVVEY